MKPKKRLRKTRIVWNIHQRIFFVLIIAVLILGTLNVAKAKGWLLPEPTQIPIVNGVIHLDDLTLEQKIAQMVVVAGSPWNMEAWKRLQVGGIHLYAMEKSDLYKQRIAQFQEGMNVPFFVTVDLEGCQNPFGTFYHSVANSEIQTPGEAFEKGVNDGKVLRELGFTINYAPVVDLGDEIWKCRAFHGNASMVGTLAQAYVLGLQDQEIMATAKHYPGKTLVVRDPHKFQVKAIIEEEDIFPYDYLWKKGDIQAVMITHVIASGKVDSQDVPAVVSPSVLEKIKEQYHGLLITDEINMLGLRNFYPTLDEMYVAVFAAGNDLILNFNEDPLEIYRMISVVAEAVERENLSEERIDTSVRKILQAKGFSVR